MVNKTDYREVTVCRNDLYTVGLVSGGFKVWGAEARLKRGPSDDVTILSQL